MTELQGASRFSAYCDADVASPEVMREFWRDVVVRDRGRVIAQVEQSGVASGELAFHEKSLNVNARVGSSAKHPIDTSAAAAIATTTITTTTINEN